MPRIGLTMTFTDDDGTMRSENHSVEIPAAGDRAGERRVAHNLMAELKVSVGAQAAPKHNATARLWAETSNRPASFENYFDIENSQALWLELSNLIMGVESDLILSQAYKDLEPHKKPPFEDDAAINDLYYIHDRKMTLLNQAIYGLIKVQDLVNRLLHESLGGDLVDTGKPDWDEDNLKRVHIVKGLEKKRAAGVISQADFDAVSTAVKIPTDTPKGTIAKTYRNRLMHHVRPSVDYSMFFSYVVSRAGEEVKNAQAKVVGRQHAVLAVLARPPVQYRFAELHSAFMEYLDAVVLMLQKLSEIEILRQ